MAIENMRLLRIAGSLEHIESILLTAFTTQDLHAELAAHVVNEGNGGTLLKEDSTFEDYLNRIESTARSLHIELKERYNPELDTKHVDDLLQHVEYAFEKINEQQMQYSGLTKEDKEAIETLREYQIDKMAQTKFTSVNFGRLPIVHLPKLDQIEDTLLAYTVLSKNNHYAWILSVTTTDHKAQVQDIFEHLYFEEIALPKLDDQKLLHICEEELEEIYGYVSRNARIRRLYKYIAVFEDQCVITGFVPQSTVKAFKTQFGDMTDVIIQDFPAGAEEGLEPPTKLRNNWFISPFELFVDMYAMPRYHDFDPTTFLGLTYCLLFGIMFGDLGQGFLLFIGGYLLNRKKPAKLKAVVMRLGLFSMFFGLLFGSVFGNEELLNPFYTDILGLPGKPFHVLAPDFTTTLLLSAAGLGAALILSSISYNIYGQLKRKQVGEALFSHNGVAGFIFYGSVLAIAALQVGMNIQVANPLTIGLGIILPLVLILFRVPLKNFVAKVAITPHEGWGGYLTESIFELIEILLSFITNTLSFLRVGGFVLSHAGMMMVVMILNEMVGGVGGIFVVIFGNLFVMGLEGLIVGIQTVRLQYYEMFSRYYAGGGKKYVPTAVKY